MILYFLVQCWPSLLPNHALKCSREMISSKFRVESNSWKTFSSLHSSRLFHPHFSSSNQKFSFVKCHGVNRRRSHFLASTHDSTVVCDFCEQFYAAENLERQHEIVSRFNLQLLERKVHTCSCQVENRGLCGVAVTLLKALCNFHLSKFLQHPVLLSKLEAHSFRASACSEHPQPARLAFSSHCIVLGLSWQAFQFAIFSYQ